MNYLRFIMAAAGLLALLTSPIWADDVRVFGDKVVPINEVIAGDVIAVTGNLIIQGHIEGSAVALIGDITLDSSAVVDGNVVAKRGRVYRSPTAQVAGDIIEGRLPELKIGREEEDILASEDREWAEEDWESPEWTKHRYHWTFSEETDVKAAYSKVDGLYLGLTFNHFPVSDYGIHFRTFGSGGYAFASHSWQGQGGFGFGVLPSSPLELSVDAFHFSHTEDSWYMSDTENSLAAFFLHEDFRDYYLREGFGTTLSWRPAEILELSARYQGEQHRGLENETGWALFGGHKSFLPNLPIEEGMLREFIFALNLDSRDDEDSPLRGWRVEAELEWTDPDLASDFDYRRAVLDVRRYQPLTSHVNFDTRIRLGNSDGTLPLQKRFYLGGPSSLPGFELKEFSGREFALWNGEIRLHDSSHGRDGILGPVCLFFFADVGMTADQSLTDLHAREWASDVGVGISDDSGTFRFQVAKRTDTAYDPYTFMLRIQRPF